MSRFAFALLPFALLLPACATDEASEGSGAETTEATPQAESGERGVLDRISEHAASFSREVQSQAGELSGQVAEEFDDIADSVATTSQEARDRAAELADEASNGLAELSDDLVTAGQEAQDRAVHLAHDLSEEISDAEDRVADIAYTVRGQAENLEDRLASLPSLDELEDELTAASRQLHQRAQVLGSSLWDMTGLESLDAIGEHVAYVRAELYARAQELTHALNGIWAEIERYGLPVALSIRSALAILQFRCSIGQLRDEIVVPFLQLITRCEALVCRLATTEAFRDVSLSEIDFEGLAEALGDDALETGELVLDLGVFILVTKLKFDRCATPVNPAGDVQICISRALLDNAFPLLFPSGRFQPDNIGRLLDLDLDQIAESASSCLIHSADFAEVEALLGQARAGAQCLE